MILRRLPFHVSIASYKQQAELLLGSHRGGDPDAIRLIHHNHPRFLDPKVPWLPGELTPAEIQRAAFSEEDAFLAIARWYDFRDWNALIAYARSVASADSAVYRFESAVEAVVDGDAAALRGLLGADRDLVRARSTRITKFDPPAHRAMLLHYVAANGVEGYRQRTPPNAVEIARLLLEAGADPNALANLYGGACTTMSLLVSSSHPAEADLQVPLVELLVGFGATVEPHGQGKWTSPLMTALTFGFRDTAEALARCGARIDSLPAAAGLGYEAAARDHLARSDAETRHRALALAAQHGHADIVAMLLDAGEDPNRYNPEGYHSHTTPLHQAVFAGHLAVVRLLVERGASLTMEDTIYHGTPLGWALHGSQTEIAEYLQSRGAR